MIGSGTLDRRLTIVRASGSQNGYGELDRTWSTLTTIWAERRDVSDGERIAMGEQTAALVSRFRVRSTGVTRTITARDRAICGGDTFEITGIKEVGRNAFLEITAIARDDQ
ncbi:MAG: head-tail adaptor protein [Hyphomicrobiaceae bacterium]|nr:head-tail adaptor protein [Hyphomicrobiaceae bacterium]MCC0024627.1 head-tail adaptor protein [Hyphomicrobiaceae bacterium]